MSSRLTFTPKMEQAAHHQALTEVAQARKNLHEQATKEWLPVRKDAAKYDELMAIYRELDATMLAEKPAFVEARVQQFREWVESLPADAPEELFA